MDQHHATREAASDVLDANGDHRNMHAAHHLGQNGPGDTNNNNNHIKHPSTDDNFSSNASSHKHGRMSRHPSISSVDDRSVKSGDDSDGAESTNGAKGSDTEISHLLNHSIWIPPQAADKEDEAESFDDDDDYSDGIKWGHSSFPSPGKEDEASPSNPREEREKAMLEAMNGQLKILVSRFLASAGISSPRKRVATVGLTLSPPYHGKRRYLLNPMVPWERTWTLDLTSRSNA